MRSEIEVCNVFMETDDLGQVASFRYTAIIKCDGKRAEVLGDIYDTKRTVILNSDCEPTNFGKNRKEIVAACDRAARLQLSKDLVSGMS